MLNYFYYWIYFSEKENATIILTDIIDHVIE